MTIHVLCGEEVAVMPTSLEDGLPLIAASINAIGVLFLSAL